MGEVRSLAVIAPAGLGVVISADPAALQLGLVAVGAVRGRISAAGNGRR